MAQNIIVAAEAIDRHAIIVVVNFIAIVGAVDDNVVVEVIDLRASDEIGVVADAFLVRIADHFDAPLETDDIVASMIFFGRMSVVGIERDVGRSANINVVVDHIDIAVDCLDGAGDEIDETFFILGISPFEIDDDRHLITQRISGELNLIKSFWT